MNGQNPNNNLGNNQNNINGGLNNEELGSMTLGNINSNVGNSSNLSNTVNSLGSGVNGVVNGGQSLGSNFNTQMGNPNVGLENQSMYNQNNMNQPIGNNFVNQSVNNNPNGGITNANQMSSVNSTVGLNQGINNQNMGLNQGMVNQNPTPVAQPIPGTEGLMSEPLKAGNQIINEANNNSFVNPRKAESIGTVPPNNQENNQKKKKPMNKLLFIILVIALIGAVAYGVYYFLSISGGKVKLSVKTVNLGVGETIPDKITDYATITKGDASSCTINQRNVNNQEIGEYEVTITCGKDVYKTKVVVSDKEAPQVELKTVFKVVNETVKIEDFVDSCIDPSNCTTKFVNEETVKNYLTNSGGPFKIEIEAQDSAGNSKTYEAELYVLPYKALTFTVATSKEEQMSNYQAKKIVKDILPIGSAGDAGLKFLEVGRRSYKYIFTNEEEYKQVIGNKENKITFDGVTGSASYDDENKTLLITMDLSLDTLKNENNGTFSLDYSAIRTLYDSKGYSLFNAQDYEKALEF